MKQLHLWISGRVQGVGFRHFTTQQARALGLSGWVKNLNDGRVEAVLKGSGNAINEMLSQLEQGPRLASVKQIEKEEEPIDNSIHGFSVKY